MHVHRKERGSKAENEETGEVGGERLSREKEVQ